MTESFAKWAERYDRQRDPAETARLRAEIKRLRKVLLGMRCAWHRRLDDEQPCSGGRFDTLCRVARMALRRPQ
jgi:hypothetical protein